MCKQTHTHTLTNRCFNLPHTLGLIIITSTHIQLMSYSSIYMELYRNKKGFYNDNYEKVSTITSYFTKQL